ncbi:MAG: hypothetical protein JNK27_00025 [Chitinophagaceae bacterium]|nr:hypothetical protein [Chitinophagaceae bacterium]
MLKTPLQIFQDHYKEQVQRDQKKNEFQYTQTDTFVTWLIGFGFTGLVLVVSNFRKLQEDFHAPVKPIVILIICVICFGILFRFISFLIMSWEKDLEEYYAAMFSPMQMTPLEPLIDLEKATVNQLVHRLESDFGIKHHNVVYFDDAKKLEVLPALKKEYLEQCEQSRVSLFQAREFVADIEYETHRIPRDVNRKAFDKAFHSKSKEGYHSNRWNNVRMGSFILTLLAFLSAIVLTGIALLSTN